MPELKNEELFEQKADVVIENTSILQNLNMKFSKYLQSQFQLETLTKKLQNWYNLDFVDFITELNKAIKKVGGDKLTKSVEMEWMEVFEEKKVEVLKLKSEIDRIDKEIDQLVYELYGLTDNEIAIVEGV